MPLFFNYMAFIENIFSSYEGGPYSPTDHISPNSPTSLLCEYLAPTHARTYRGAQESDMDCWDGIVALKKTTTTKKKNNNFIFVWERGRGSRGYEVKTGQLKFSVCLCFCAVFFFFKGPALSIDQPFSNPFQTSIHISS